jgi:hypothetical protein
MLSIISLVMSFCVMFGLWALAWRMWKQASVFELDEVAYQPPSFRSEPAPERQAPSPPPSWLFEGQAGERDAPSAGGPGGVPVQRRQPSSSANTSFFSAEELERAQEIVEMTEILDEADLFEGLAAAAPSVDTTPKARNTLLLPKQR